MPEREIDRAIGRLQDRLPVGKLYLDVENPRFSYRVENPTEKKLLLILYREYNLRELACSIAENGYFDEEPLVIVPRKLPEEFSDQNWQVLNLNDSYLKFLEKESTDFTVVEGNRRLATVKLLLDPELIEGGVKQRWPSITDIVRENIQQLPVIVYASRSDVVPYLGARHIIGIKKWEPYAKASYIAQLVEMGKKIEEIQESVGDTVESTRKSYLSYRLVKIIEEEGLDVRKAESNFSYLLLTLGQKSIREYIGMDKPLSRLDYSNPVPPEKIDKLKNLFRWFFGEDSKQPAIDDSRQITNLLSHVVRNTMALEHFERTGNLQDAYELSDGEEHMLFRKLANASMNMEIALGIIHRHLQADGLEDAVAKCFKDARELQKKVERGDRY